MRFIYASARTLTALAAFFALPMLTTGAVYADDYVRVHPTRMLVLRS